MRARVVFAALTLGASGCADVFVAPGLPTEGNSPPTTEPPRTQSAEPQLPTTSPPEPWEPAWPPLQTALEHYEISFGDATAAIVYDDGSRDYAPGRFKASGVWHEVEVRRRGDSARFHPKDSWKVKMPEGQRFKEARRHNFLAEWLDGGYLTDMFAYRLMAAAGVHAPRSEYVTLSVNGEYQGIYTSVEQVDKHFVRNHGLELDANVYRCGSKDCEIKVTPPAHYQKPWVKKTNKDFPSDDLNAFLHAVSRTPEHALEAFLERHMHLEAYLRYMAVNALISNHGIDDSGSYFAHELRADKWLIAPWDLNNARMLYWRSEAVTTRPRVAGVIPVYTIYDPLTLRTYEHKESKYGGAHRPFSVLSQRIWDRPALRNRVLDYLERLLATVFEPGVASAQIDALHALIKDELPKDPWVDQAHAAYAPEFLKAYVAGRVAFLATEIPNERRRGEGGVVINAIGAPGGAAKDERGEADGFIELYNREDTPADLGGLTITDSLRDEFKHRLPSGLVVPPRGTLVLWADGQTAQGPNHLPFLLGVGGGELGLFDGKSMNGLIDQTFYGPLPGGREYARMPEGSEDWGWRR